MLGCRRVTEEPCIAKANLWAEAGWGCVQANIIAVDRQRCKLVDQQTAAAALKPGMHDTYDHEGSRYVQCMALCPRDSVSCKTITVTQQS